MSPFRYALHAFDFSHVLKVMDNYTFKTTIQESFDHLVRRQSMMTDPERADLTFAMSLTEAQHRVNLYRELIIDALFIKIINSFDFYYVNHFFDENPLSKMYVINSPKDLSHYIARDMFERPNTHYARSMNSAWHELIDELTTIVYNILVFPPNAAGHNVKYKRVDKTVYLLIPND